VYSGMVKYRGDLTTMIEWNYRYVLAGSIFFVWIICCVISDFQPLIRYTAIALILLAGSNSVLIAKRAGEKIQVDRNWSEWAEKIERGIPVVVPIDPNWSIKIG